MKYQKKNKKCYIKQALQRLQWWITAADSVELLPTGYLSFKQKKTIQILWDAERKESKSNILCFSVLDIEIFSFFSPLMTKPGKLLYASI